MKTAILMSLLIAAAACERNATDTDRAGVEKAANAPADNTKRNELDRGTAALTPMDQGNSEGDLAITQQIRQSVVKDETMSMSAKNIKIITVGGMVTLRGPVRSGQERAEIASLARGVPGVRQVDNQLEIAAN